MANTGDSDTPPPASDDPAVLLPLEAAREHLVHWWREPAAGLLALGAGLFDTWHYGRDAGLSSSLDEILVIGGVVLIAGSRRLFSGALPGAGNGQGGK
jgi:uncharacterized membrane protein YgdD (TMEM256/DUF423 family)